MIRTKAGFTTRFIFNSAVTVAALYLAWVYGLISISPEKQDSDIFMLLGYFLILAPLTIYLVAGIVEALGLVLQLLTLGLFGILTRIVLWGLVLFFTHNAFAFFSVKVVGFEVPFLILSTVLALFKLREKN